MNSTHALFAAQTKTQEALSPAEAYAAIALSAIASDGYLTDAEVHVLLNTLKRMPLFRHYSDDVMWQMFAKLFGIIRREGVGTLFNSAKQVLPGEFRESAFAVATDLVLVDSLVVEKEREFLTQMHQALDIANDTAFKIVEVMLIKNRL